MPPKSKAGRVLKKPHKLIEKVPKVKTTKRKTKVSNITPPVIVNDDIPIAIDEPSTSRCDGIQNAQNNSTPSHTIINAVISPENPNVTGAASSIQNQDIPAPTMHGNGLNINGDLQPTGFNINPQYTANNVVPGLNNNFGTGMYYHETMNTGIPAMNNAYMQNVQPDIAVPLLNGSNVYDIQGTYGYPQQPNMHNPAGSSTFTGTHYGNNAFVPMQNINHITGAPIPPAYQPTPGHMDRQQFVHAYSQPHMGNNFGNNSNTSTKYGEWTPLDFHIEGKYKALIVTNQYVELDKINNDAPASESNNYQVSINRGQNALPIFNFSEPPPDSKNLSLTEWSRAFLKYMYVYVDKYPHQTKNLLTYMHSILKMAKEGKNWRLYDSQFRTSKAWNNMPWNMINLPAFSDAGNTPVEVAKPQLDIKKPSLPFLVPRGYCTTFHKGMTKLYCDH